MLPTCFPHFPHRSPTIRRKDILLFVVAKNSHTFVYVSIHFVNFAWPISHTRRITWLTPFYSKGDKPAVCIPCDELLTVESIFAVLFRFDWSNGTAFYSSLSLTMSDDISFDCIFDCLKEINILWNVIHFGICFCLTDFFKLRFMIDDVLVLTGVYFLAFTNKPYGFCGR